MNKIFKAITMLLKYTYYKLLDLLAGRKSSKKEIEAEFGDLDVSGRGEVEIDLPTLPKVIEVKFKDHSHHIPCDQHHDKLEYSLHRHHHAYKLIIKWHINSLREIAWIAYF